MSDHTVHVLTHDTRRIPPHPYDRGRPDTPYENRLWTLLRRTPITHMVLACTDCEWHTRGPLRHGLDWGREVAATHLRTAHGDGLRRGTHAIDADRETDFTRAVLG